VLLAIADWQDVHEASRPTSQIDLGSGRKAALSSAARSCGCGRAHRSASLASMDDEPDRLPRSTCMPHMRRTAG